jgi:hypothetical protein
MGQAVDSRDQQRSNFDAIMALRRQAAIFLHAFDKSNPIAVGAAQRRRSGSFLCLSGSWCERPSSFA